MHERSNNKKPLVLIVDDDQAVRTSIALALRLAGMAGEGVGNETDALTRVRDEAVKAVILDMNLTLTTTGQQGMEMLQKIKVLRPTLPVLLITAWGTIPLAVEAMNHGAADFITKPWDNSMLVERVKAAIESENNKRANTLSLDELEQRAVADAMKVCGANMTEAARMLGITRQSLYRRLEKYKK